MAHTDFASMACPIARSMAVLGERWTILLLREAYYGSTRFDDFQRNLGIAPNILSARLKTLVEHGVFEKVADEGARHCYRLTQRGRDFFPAFVALKAWADRWMTDASGPLTVLRDAATGDEIVAPRLARPDGSPITVEDLQVTAGPGASDRLRRRFSGEAHRHDTAASDAGRNQPARETGNV